MKKLLIVAMIALFGVMSLTAKETVNALSVDLSTEYQSEYVFRGEKIANHVVASTVAVDYKGIYLGATYFADLDNTITFDDEVNVIGGIKFTNDAITPVVVDVGLTAYIYPDANKSIGETEKTFEPYIGATLTEVLFNPSVYVYYDLDKDALTVESAVSYTFGFVDVPVVELIDFTPYAIVGYTDIKDVTPKSVNVKSSYYYVETGVKASYEIFDGASVYITPVYSFTEKGTRDFDNLSVQTGIGYSF